MIRYSPSTRNTEQSQPGSTKDPIDSRHFALVADPHLGAYRTQATRKVHTQRWEYLLVGVESVVAHMGRDANVSPDQLNELGAKGWEAVGLVSLGSKVLLKRPVE
jgi:hypothetical protein